jgi:hypothetical protein
LRMHGFAGTQAEESGAGDNTGILNEGPSGKIRTNQLHRASNEMP